MKHSSLSKTCDHHLDSIMADIETFYSKFGTIEEHCNTYFEEKLFKEIINRSKDSVLKKISIFIEKEFQLVFEFGQQEQDVWRRWLEHNQRSWHKILNVSGFTLAQ